ncbi:acyl-CoA dehydrogenase family protein [Phenylobacterium sp. VNQ135]|uniref:acyl-CoA dehydrogenase family protein n=1 Tax=Phenylobacterium sp. VNQ135 TaxID=3400922 RepID=UPI003C11399D
MDIVLDEATLAFRREVQAFLSDELTEELRRGQALTTGLYPPPKVSQPWQRKLAARGWMAPLWPQEFGGAGWTPLQRFIFESECALAGAPLVHPMGVRLLGPVLIRFGTPEQKAHYLPRILRSEDYWCQGYSEPAAGSDLTSLQTSARSDGDSYVVNGSKIWTTHAHYANKMFMLVRTSNIGRPRDGISFLLVDLDAPGITVRPIVSMSGEHELNQVFFDNVRIAKENLVGNENGGWACAQYLLEFERGAGLFSARLRSSLTRLRAVIDEFAEGGVSPLDDPTNAARFAEVAIDLDTFEMLELRSLDGMRQGERSPALPSILKLRASRMKQAVAELGMTLLGRRAARWHSSLECDTNSFADTAVSEYLNSRAYTIFGGSSEVQLGLIARQFV